MADDTTIRDLVHERFQRTDDKLNAALAKLDKTLDAAPLSPGERSRGEVNRSLPPLPKPDCGPASACSLLDRSFTPRSPPGTAAP
jgi:hypothetical protein